MLIENNTRSIVLIVPYFGKLPNYFSLWLTSCKYNPTVNWILYTDCKGEHIYPSNVKVVECSFKDIQNQIQSIFDFDIELGNPYKLCDYKPTYGEVFQKDIAAYDFWGYCDVDLIFGNIRKFLTEEILEKYDRVLALGHFSIFKNNTAVNGTYRNSIESDVPHKRVFTNAKHFGFDEHGKNHLNDLFENSAYKTYINNKIFADINSFFKHFVSTYARKLVKLSEIEELTDNENWKGKSTIYSFNRGNLFRHQLLDNELTEMEYMYVHLQKRGMQVKPSVKTDQFLIVPSKFIPLQEVSKRTLKKYGSPKIFYHRRVKRLLYSKIRMFVYRNLGI